jgi:hypothetical protein
MTDSTRRPLDDAALVAALRDLAMEIDWPASDWTTDVATRVRARLADRPVAAAGVRRSWRPVRPWWHPAPRGLAIALIILLAFAAIAGAVGLGLPGLRLLLGGPSSSPPPVAPSSSATAPGSTPPGPPGSTLGLGERLDLAAIRAAVDRPLGVPSDPTIGPPAATYLDRAKGESVALVWAVSPDLPATRDPGVGLLLISFDGTIEAGYWEKVIDTGTSVGPVRVGTDRGFWISGDPHMFFFVDAAGGFVQDSRRWVGDALIWSNGTTTWRLETSLGRDAALRIAESLRSR